ncbi:XkdX family protein [Paenibacillus sp. ACRRX]|nr:MULTISPECIES: XkdX family protein [unclassified Paenibacillus]MCG7410137.1 XkdX family protein [Paenibacillus sp. ACRRX]MDK8183710.1 XkdX family protein [Paenibacillus sp. UMB4589-SE434]
MEFWKHAYNLNWISAEILRRVVKTDINPSGEITQEQYADITGITFEGV